MNRQVASFLVSQLLALVIVIASLQWLCWGWEACLCAGILAAVGGYLLARARLEVGRPGELPLEELADFLWWLGQYLLIAVALAAAIGRLYRWLLTGELKQRAPPDAFTEGTIAVLTVGGLVLYFLVYCQPPIPEESNVVEGAEVISLQQARAIAKQRFPITRLGFFVWLGIVLPLLLATRHFLLLGAQGSGKSVLLGCLNRSFVTRVIQGRARLVIFDPKHNLIPQLIGMGLSRSRIHLSEPMDVRGEQWDIQKDNHTLLDCITTASNIISEEGSAQSRSESGQFFLWMSRSIFALALYSLIVSCKGRFVLNDLGQIIQRKDLLARLLSKTPQGRAFLPLFSDSRLWMNIYGSLMQKLGLLLPVWEMTKDAPLFSVQDFLKSNDVLVLSYNHQHPEPGNAMSRAIFSRFTQFLLSGPPLESQGLHQENHTFVVLDEMRLLERLGGALPQLIYLGRDYLCSVVMATQTWKPMESIWGKEVAEELYSLPWLKGWLLSDSYETGRLASETIGRQRVWQTSYSHGAGGSSSSTESMHEQDAVLASTFASFRPPLPGDPIEMMGRCPGIGTWRGCLDWDFLNKMLVPPDPDTPGYLPRDHPPGSSSELTDADLERLGLLPDSEPPPDPPGPKRPGTVPLLIHPNQLKPRRSPTEEP